MKMPDGWVFRTVNIKRTSLTLEQEELICCYNCRHSAMAGNLYSLDCIRLIDEGITFPVSDDGFCSWAEKEED